MAHSHDRTLLASLGFQDPDRKDPRHSLACQYLARPEVAEKVWRRLRPKIFVPPTSPPREGQYRDAEILAADPEFHLMKGEGKYQTTIGFVDLVLNLDVQSSSMSEREVVVQPARPERVRDPVSGRLGSRWGTFSPVTWDDGEALSTPAPLDLEVVERSVPERKERRSILDWHLDRERVAIEVKTNKVDVADIARQLDLYRQYEARLERNEVGSYVARIHWAVALTWQLHPEEKAVLAAKGIDVLWLGPPFEQYVAERREAPAASDDEPI